MPIDQNEEAVRERLPLRVSNEAQAQVPTKRQADKHMGNLCDKISEIGSYFLHERHKTNETGTSSRHKRELFRLFLATVGVCGISVFTDQVRCLVRHRTRWVY